MNKFVINGASLRCVAGSSLTKLRAQSRLMINGQSVATVLDGLPENIGCFGYCSLSGGPCMPITKLWISSGPRLNNLAILNQSSTLQCAIGGQVLIVDPGQVIVQKSVDAK